MKRKEPALRNCDDLMGMAYERLVLKASNNLLPFSFPF